MITYRIYHIDKFEEDHRDFFSSNLTAIKKQGFLSPRIDEIIITDDIENEIDTFCKDRYKQPTLTRTREYLVIAKTVDFDGKYKIFFDAFNVNKFTQYASQIFFEQLIEVQAESVVESNHTTSNRFYPNTPLTEVVSILFFHWAAKVVANDLEKQMAFKQEKIHSEIKIYVDAFKRSIRKLHYQHQADLNLDLFWINVVTSLDNFVRRCLDVKYDNGNFSGLQEFNEIIPSLLSEIEFQAQRLRKRRSKDFSPLTSCVKSLLEACYIKIGSENPMSVEVTESPKKLFKGTLVDTEPRIVAFIDILGFSSIIEEYDSNETSNILNELHDTLEQAIKVSIEMMIKPEIKTDLRQFLEYRMFSDCICISLPYIDYGSDFDIQFYSISTVVKSYQLSMMQKGFFVRGGISMGSYFADKNMIFSGGLVNAYKLDKGTPTIEVDRTIIERLKRNYLENSGNQLFSTALIYFKKDPTKIFLNPFDLIDNANNYLEYIQKAMNDLTNEIDVDPSDPISRITNSLLHLTNTLTRHVINLANAQIQTNGINQIKEEILGYINDQIKLKELTLLKSTPEEAKELSRVISKFKFLQSLTEWSLCKERSNHFEYFSLN